MENNNQKQEDSFDTPEEVTEEVETETVSMQSDATLTDVLSALRELQADKAETDAELARLRSQIAGGGEMDEEVEQDRRPAGSVKIATYEGSPIIDMKLEKNIERNHNGEMIIKNYKAICKIHGNDETVELTYGELGNPLDYLNLPREKYALTDQDSSDLSGASKIEHNQIISRGEKVDEIDRSSGLPVKTGKKIELVTRNDIRYYTIVVGDDKVTLRQDKIYR